MPTRPLSNRLHLFSGPLMAGEDFPSVVLGDSTVDDGSSNYMFHYGVNRTWRPPALVGFTSRTVSGPTARLFDVAVRSSETNGVTTEETGGFALQRVGSDFSGGQSACFPVRSQALTFNANNVDGTVLCRFDLLDTTNNASLTAWTGNYAKARFIYWQDSGMLDGFRLQSRRNAAVSGTISSTFTAVGTAGVAYKELNISNGAGYPGATLEYAGGVTETGKRMYLGGANIVRCDSGGNRLPGFFLSNIAYSGWTSLHLLGALGASENGFGLNIDTSSTLPNATVAQANVVAWLQANYSPKYWFVKIGINTVTAASHTAAGEYENVELAAGTYATYKRHVRKIIEQIRVLHTAMGLAGLPQILLINPYNYGNTTIESGARGDALYELSCEYEAVGFLDEYQLMALSPVGANGWWTSDDVHATQDGISYEAACLWCAILTDYHSRNQRTPL